MSETHIYVKATMKLGKKKRKNYLVSLHEVVLATNSYILAKTPPYKPVLMGRVIKRERGLRLDNL